MTSLEESIRSAQLQTPWANQELPVLQAVPVPPYRWSSAIRRYVGADGRLVPWFAIRTVLADAEVREIGEVKDLSRSLAEGGVDLSYWQVRMAQVIKRAHLINAAIVMGGWSNLDAETHEVVTLELQQQYRYLDRFARQLEDGLLLDGRFMNRVAMYVRSARKTYHAVERRAMAKRGYDQERSILGPTEGCVQCRMEAERGWQPMGSIIPIGLRGCLSNCGCVIVYRASTTGTVWSPIG